MNMFKVCLAANVFFVACISYGASFVATEASGSRFGDQLSLYAKAKAVSYLFGLTYLHRPFLYSKYLQLHRMETPYRNKHFSKIIKVKDAASLPQLLNENKEDNVLYLVNYYTRLNLFGLESKFWQCLQKFVRPVKPIGSVIPNEFVEDTVTVAVHVRKGDATRHKRYFGTKWHLDEDYIKVLYSLLRRLETAVAYVYIFTDDRNPRELMKKIERGVKQLGAAEANACCHIGFRLPTITFDCNSRTNKQTPQAIFSDFFNIISFDYLVRPRTSNFSVMAGLIGQHKEVLPVCSNRRNAKKGRKNK